MSKPNGSVVVPLDAYLVMLLEMGTLHGDPNSGNLIRTTDGKMYERIGIKSI